MTEESNRARILAKTFLISAKRIIRLRTILRRNFFCIYHPILKSFFIPVDIIQKKDFLENFEDFLEKEKRKLEKLTSERLKDTNADKNVKMFYYTDTLRNKDTDLEKSISNNIEDLMKGGIYFREIDIKEKSSIWKMNEYCYAMQQIARLMSFEIVKNKISEEKINWYNDKYNALLLEFNEKYFALQAYWTSQMELEDINSRDIKTKDIPFGASVINVISKKNTQDINEIIDAMKNFHKNRTNSSRETLQKQKAIKEKYVTDTWIKMLNNQTEKKALESLSQNEIARRIQKKVIPDLQTIKTATGKPVLKTKLDSKGTIKYTGLDIDTIIKIMRNTKSDKFTFNPFKK